MSAIMFPGFGGILQVLNIVPELQNENQYNIQNLQNPAACQALRRDQRRQRKPSPRSQKNESLVNVVTDKRRHIHSRYTSSAAEVSKIGSLYEGFVVVTQHGRANPLMDRKVVGAVFSGMVAMVAVVTSPQLLDEVGYNAVVVVGVVVVVV